MRDNKPDAMKNDRVNRICLMIDPACAIYMIEIVKDAEEELEKNLRFQDDKRCNQIKVLRKCQNRKKR